VRMCNTHLFIIIIAYRVTPSGAV